MWRRSPPRTGRTSTAAPARPAVWAGPAPALPRWLDWRLPHLAIEPQAPRANQRARRYPPTADPHAEESERHSLHAPRLRQPQPGPTAGGSSFSTVRSRREGSGSAWPMSSSTSSTTRSSASLPASQRLHRARRTGLRLLRRVPVHARPLAALCPEQRPTGCSDARPPIWRNAACRPSPAAADRAN